MWAKELIRRADQKVYIQHLYVDWTMRCKLHSIDPGQRANCTGPTNDCRHIVNSAYCIRGITYGDEPGTGGNICSHIFHVESHGFRVDVNSAYHNATLLQRKPGRHAGVMIQNRHYTVAAWLEHCAKCTAESKGEGG